VTSPAAALLLVSVIIAISDWLFRLLQRWIRLRPTSSVSGLAALLTVAAALVSYFNTASKIKLLYLLSKSMSQGLQ
jgi:hypothetical protein